MPGWGLLLTVERWTEEVWGRRLWWKMPVEESQAAMEARRCCWVTRRGWSQHHSLSLSTVGSWTVERPACRMPDSLNYRVGPHPGCPCKCLMRWTIEKDPSQGAKCLQGGAMKKDWPKRSSDHQLQEAWKKTLKDSDRASLIAQLVKNLPVMQETLVWFLCWEDPLEKGKATHSSIVAWRIP